MEEKALTARSKFLSLVLRHQPELIGIVLDEAGWTPVDELLHKMAAAGRPISRETLRLVVETNSKKRFAFDESGLRIRASQGHSVNIDTGYAPVPPPPLLYHGTASRFLTPILQEGLLKQGRQHVHLSTDLETAREVGRRHGQPVVLQVDAAAMQAAGHSFYLSDNGVWLTGAVPPQYLSTVSDTKPA